MQLLPKQSFIQSRRAADLLFVALICSFAFAGGRCVDLQKEYPEKRYFVLNVENQRPADGAASPVIAESLKIGRFRVSPRFANRGLVYRRSDVVYEADFYNEFLTGVADNTTEESRQWLARSGVFSRVVDLTSQVPACYILEAQINELYADLRNQPASVIEIQFILLRYADAVLFERTYPARTAATSTDGEALVVAHNRSLAEILSKLTDDLKQISLPGCDDDEAPAAKPPATSSR